MPRMGDGVTLGSAASISVRVIAGTKHQGWKVNAVENTFVVYYHCPILELFFFQIKYHFPTSHFPTFRPILSNNKPTKFYLRPITYRK